MVNGMKLSAGPKCVKYLMFIFNLLFVITGIILLSIGTVILGVYHGYYHFLDNRFLSVPSLLVAIGVIIFIVAFFGCCGAVRENYCMVVTFITLMILVFILELSGGISGYVLRNRAASVINEKMLATMKLYGGENDEITAGWNALQKKCCGTTNMTDWKDHSDLFNSTELPSSCCPLENFETKKTNCTVDTISVYKVGCLPQFLVVVKSHAVQLGGVGIGIAFVQAIGIWFSLYLARSIRNSYETV